MLFRKSRSPAGRDYFLRTFAATIDDSQKL